MRTPVLVVDHDDTVVNSTATVHYPCFVEYTRQYFPAYTCTLEHYFLRNFDPGVIAFFRDEVGMSEEDMRHEQAWWNEYVQSHVPEAYPGMAELLWEQRNRGGRICVVSHSYGANVLRDWRANGLPEPDRVYGWEVPREQRKPEPWALREIMRAYGVGPEALLVLDDLKPGYDMARAAGVSFAAAGWANDIPEIEAFMRANSDFYFKTVAELRRFLFD